MGEFTKIIKLLELEAKRLETFKEHNKAHGLPYANISKDRDRVNSVINELSDGDNGVNTESKCNKHIVMGSIFDLPMECVPDPENDDTCERCRFEREDANSDICVYCRKNNATGLYYP